MSDAIGLPQLNVSSYPSQVFWLAVAFTVLYVLMSKVALPRVAAVLETRRTQKDGDLDQASRMNDEAETIKTAYEKSLAKAQQSAAEVRVKSEKAIAEKIAATEARFVESSRNRLVEAEGNIAKAKADALRSLADISAEVAAEMVHKIADIQVNKADAKAAVMSVMQEG